MVQNHRKLQEKLLIPEIKKNPNNVNHLVLEINQEKKTKPLFRNL